MESALKGQLSKITRQRTAPLILELDLTDGVQESRPPDPLSAVLTRHRATITDVVAGLKLARADDRVKALVVKVGGRPIGLGLVQELREAVKRFGAAGKPTVAWAETFGEFSPGNVPYYLATAFQTIYLQPSGELGLTGLAVERTFLRGALDKLGVSVEVSARHEYKSAAEMVTERGFSPASREATQRVAESITDQIIDAIAERVQRGAPGDRPTGSAQGEATGSRPSGSAQIGRDEAVRLINQGPFLAERALAEGLVDVLAYRDEVYSAVRKLVGGGDQPELLYLSRYQRSKELANRARQVAAPRQNAVALIQATGAIRRGRSGRSGMSGSAMGADSITSALRAATADPRISAIVLRVDSPGGSYVASDAIWREVVRARSGGKPIVVSMGDLAASGGYFISMAADSIVAQPGTLTGSIGVLTAKPVLSDMLSSAGVTTDSVVTGDHAEIYSTNHRFTDEEWALVNHWLDHIYADFTGKVAVGRGLPADRVHELAKGRVWTGADAHERGLVDQLGGLEDAAAIARRRAGLSATAPLVGYPRLSPLERLMPASSSEDRRMAAWHGAQAAWPLPSPPVLAGTVLGGTVLGGTVLGGTMLGGSQAAAAAALAAMFAESWGPVWRLAAHCDMPAEGPLMLPGSWTFH